MKKIVVIGPESTGKSTLCEQLALHFHTSWCPEFAREYLLTHNLHYSFDDLLSIAKGQTALEEATIQQTLKELVFVDTDLYVIKVWGELVFDNCHTWVLDQIAQRAYDLYLLCNVDLPWQKDALREYPDLLNRQKQYHIYRDIMINQSVPWVEINGVADERFKKALEGINSIL